MKIPEPSLPEHELIRSAAPDVQLSAGLKQRVVAECAAQARLARLQLRLKIGVSTLVACCLLFALLTWNPANSAGNQTEVATEDSAPGEHSSSPGYSRSANGSNLAGHDADPDKNSETDGVRGPREMQQINEMIEERMKRNRLLECALLPFL